MKSHTLALLAGLAAVTAFPGALQASPLASATTQIDVQVTGIRTFDLVADRRYNRLKPGCRAAFCKPGYNFGKYERWKRRRDFGRAVVGTVVIGAIVATAANRIPPRPSPDLCWVWSDNSRTRGYWNYCY